MKKRVLLVPTLLLPTIATIAGCTTKGKSQIREIILNDVMSNITIEKNDADGIECTITPIQSTETIGYIWVSIGKTTLDESEYSFEIKTGKVSIPKTTLSKYEGVVVISPVLLSYFERMKLDYSLMLIDTVDCKNVSTWLDELEEDEKGFLKFKDLDYTDPDKANWPCLKHLSRTIPIVVDAVKKWDEDQFNIAVKLLQHWLTHEYTNENWWQMQIGVPRELSDLSLFLFESLTMEQKGTLLSQVKNGSLLYNEEAATRTGTNLFWHGDISMKHAWITNDYEEFNFMFKAVSNEIKENDTEGFQSDGSYYQHGRELYNGGYGRQGAILLAKIMSAFANVPITWPKEKLDIIVNFILKGIATTLQNGYTDYGTMGRTYCRKQANQIDGGTTDLGNVLIFKYVAKLPNCPHQDELNKVFKAWEEAKPSFTGVNYLSKSNFVSMNVDNIYMSFKGTNELMANTEKVNNENVLGYNLSYGTSTCVMETGEEYFDITPVWDYSSIPGTTALTQTDEELDEYTNLKRTLPTIGCVYGGGTSGNVTFSMQSTRHETTNYTVTCFATEDGMVLLGSDLSDSTGALHTTVEQCIVKKDVTPSLSDDKKTVEHGNVIYKCLSPNDKFDMTNKSVTNSWNRNNRSFPKTDTATKNVLTITIQHPSEDVNYYAYAIQPKTRKDKNYAVACNSTSIHAIELPDGKIAAAFYADDSFEYKGKTYSGSKGEYKVF